MSNFKAVKVVMQWVDENEAENKSSVY